MSTPKTQIRCTWAGNDPLMQDYHDREWGVPEYHSKALWAKLTLDGFQAGLSWAIILRKRAAFLEAFQDFDPGVVAKFGKADVNRLLKNEGIIRSRTKIEAAIGNARAYLTMAEQGEDFSKFLWDIAGGKPVRNAIKRGGPIPAKTPVSEAMSIALKKRGFKFVGPVIVYAFMQAVGMVNDHAVECFRYRKV
jgi:DNA-3-methyladenine glycosylase I